MNRLTLAALAGTAMVALPTAAAAQDDGTAGEFFVGANAGYHDLGVGDEAEDITGLEADDGAAIFGGYAGYDFPIGERAFAGVEGNFNFGTGVIDNEYGVSARVGIRSEGGAKFYVRGGYQWIDLDLEEVFDVDVPDGTFDGFDDTVDDYLVGVGAEFPAGDTLKFRVNLDTVSFDTVRATAGLQLAL